jgi:hypothetical protein
VTGNGDVLRELVKAFNPRDYERVASLLGDECKFIDVATGGKAHGIHEVVAEFKKWEGAFPDMEITTLSTVATDQGAAGEFVGEGRRTARWRDPTDAQEGRRGLRDHRG